MVAYNRNWFSQFWRVEGVSWTISEDLRKIFHVFFFFASAVVSNSWCSLAYWYIILSSASIITWHLPECLLSFLHFLQGYQWPTLIQCDLILMIISATILISNKITLTVTRDRTLTHIFQGDMTQPTIFQLFPNGYRGSSENHWQACSLNHPSTILLML